MEIGGPQLLTFQSCQRRWALERTWRVIRWRPKALFDSCFRMAILRVAEGQEPREAISEAKTRFLNQGANPGLEIAPGCDPWTVASDWVAVLSTSLLSTIQAGIPKVKLPAPKAIPAPTGGSGLAWLASSFEDDSGELHRWVSTDRLDGEETSRIVHSWQVIGDMSVYEAPMTVHVVEVGQLRNGRRHSPWCRGYKHPIISGRIKFQRNDGKGGYRSLNGGQWKPVWLSDLNASAEEWLALMDGDGITPLLLHNLTIRQPAEAARRDTLGQISTLGQGMTELAAGLAADPQGGMLLPMSRGACDQAGRPCPWQEACYRDDPRASLAGLGLYQIRKAREVASERSDQPQPTPLSA